MSRKPENERRFLLRRVPHEAITREWTESKIIQVYNPNGWRYRQCDSSSNGLEFYKTKKLTIALGVNDEEEYEILKEEFEHNTDFGSMKSLPKNRWSFHPADGIKFDLDDIDVCGLAGIKLVILEVELDDIDRKFEFPAPIQDQIICEITGMKQFSCFNLARINHF